MSARQFFNELEAVAEVLDSYVRGIGPEHFDNPAAFLMDPPQEELFAAIWQAVELLSRAYGVLLPMLAYQEAEAWFHTALGHLELPDVKVVEA